MCKVEADGEGGGGGEGGAVRARGARGVCVPLEPVRCDDGDPCTKDLCEPATGLCTHGLATLDNDGDGHRAPLPGRAPGAPDACGDDCDDTSPGAHPGGIEVCDGADNDCNGVVDDGASFTPVAEATRISGDIAPALPGGIAYGGESYIAIYTGTTVGTRVYEQALSPTGAPLPSGEEPMTVINADSSGGPIVWAGDRYGVAWQDRRSGNYEVFFTLLDPAGKKVVPDTQLTSSGGFSVNVSLAYNGLEFVVAWQDERGAGIYNVYAQRVSIDGIPIGENVAITSSTQGFDNESPAVAAGSKGLGVAWTVGAAGAYTVLFQPLAPDLSPLAPPVALTDGTTDSVYPTVVFNQDSYVVAWYDKVASPRAIYGAVVSEEGEILVPKTALTQPGAFHSRYPHLKPLGDRVLLLWSDDRDGNDGYELYSRMLSADLAPMGTEQRLTNAPRDSIYPTATFGQDGNVGILFRDDREAGEPHVYFMRLACVAGR